MQLIGAFVVAAISMIMNASSQNDKIDQANERNEAIRDSNVLNATYENRTKNIRQSQREKQINQKKFNIQLQKLEKQGQARVKGASSGLAGRAMNKLTHQFEEQAARALETLDGDLDNSRTAHRMDIKGTTKGYSSRIDTQWDRREFSSTSVAASGVEGASTGYSMGSSLKV